MHLHAQAKHAEEQAQRLRAQEAQLAAMRRQLDAMQAVGKGSIPRRGRDDTHAPVEYICPITQARHNFFSVYVCNDF